MNRFEVPTNCRCWLLSCVLVSILSVAGCDAPIASFEPNGLYLKRMELVEGVELPRAEADVQAVLTELFGTPDEPKWPEMLQAEPAYSELVLPERLQRAAGPVRSDEDDVHYGLYREHCVYCHGVTGDGLGPTSRFLNPYPRDFRMGKVKFKSTPLGKKPTRSDLWRTLHEGVSGTSMPSFRLLEQEDLEALLDYLIYLSIRGEVERKLIDEAAFELDFEAGERLYDPALKVTDPAAFDSQWEVIQGCVVDVADSWLEANDEAVVVEGPPDDYPLWGRDNNGTSQMQQRLADSVAHGRELYHGKIANCATCHGATAVGDGQLGDYDEWTKEWTTSVGIDPQKPDDLAPMLKLGGLKPRHALPRNLRTGVYRGGSRPIDLYLRIVYGIDGTPMPAAAMQPANPQGMTEGDVWDLVNYILSLPYEPLSQAAFDSSPPEQPPL
ncbi:c-type cytochrome [Aureliella helgolandensis]|uniref:Cytochrome c n=1 Tax=Aureliella helgolandensis TaxID=2527968 RepID=A0A518GH86_9BACT|nr:cytochrome c [Aureliella helgolandensis]QDV27944.1 Cytochrome c [Aureliella helgolandensis]